MSELAFSNGLNPAQLERLAMLGEEAGEVQQIIGKILRHGYESTHPDDPHITNRDYLMIELGDLLAVMKIMVKGGEITDEVILENGKSKMERIFKYTHHQQDIEGKK